MNPLLKEILNSEEKRQSETLDLIPSENFTSKAVREAVGSVFMHKYSEGYPGARYYEGNENIDALENLCIDLVKKVFKLPLNWGVNVQPLSGSNANLAVYNAILAPGDKILSMYLPDGGHLSHGWAIAETPEAKADKVHRGTKKVNIVSKIYDVVQYKTNPETSLIDYDSLRELAIAEKPKLIITGGTGYARSIDYQKIKEITDSVGALFLADVAHEAGLIAGEALESPIGIADVVTFTTHKTLRGPKGAVIVAKQDIIEKVNKSIMPGMQGGPHNGTIAGIVQALFEADTTEFKQYSAKIIENASALAQNLKDFGFNLVSGGTDKHLILIDLRNFGLSGKYLSKALNYANIVSNMNSIPYDTNPPMNPSGLRIGTPTITTRGMGIAEMKTIAELIKTVADEAVKSKDKDLSEFDSSMQSSIVIAEVKEAVLELCQKFPLP